MSPPVDKVEDNGAPPAHADVVVVGGGIIGVSAAYWLARSGVSVALVEKGHIAGEQSSRNWGWCRQQGRDERELALARESLRMWPQLQRELDTDIGFRQAGVTYLTESERELSRWVDWAKMAAGYDVDSRVLTAAQASALAPGCNRRWVGGIRTASDGRAEPARAVPALARAAQALGVSVHQRCAARGFETGAGSITTLITEKGAIRTGSVLLAAGAWSSLFCRRHGVRLPQLAVRASVARVEVGEALTEGAIGSSVFCIRKRLDGGYTLALREHNVLDLTPDAFRFFREFLTAYRQQGSHMKIRGNPRQFLHTWWRQRHWRFDAPSPFESLRVLDPPPHTGILDLAESNLRESYPGIGQLRRTDSWAGMIDVTPDALPVISPVAGVPGLVLATGFSGHGFGIGPAAGRLAADLVTGGDPLVAPQAFGFQRMRNARRLVPDSM